MDQVQTAPTLFVTDASKTFQPMTKPMTFVVIGALALYLLVSRGG